MDSTINFSNFTGYRQTVMELTADLNQLKEYSKVLNLNGNVASIDETLEKLANDSFDVAIIGEFKRGKSTLINALLGKEILPSDVLPTTATLNRVTYGITPCVSVKYKNGTSEEVEIDKLNDYVTKLSSESEQKAATVKEATIYYPTSYCKNNVDIIDTPGLNDDENMTEVTLSVLPQIDAAIFVIMAQAPFSEYERDFLENKMLTSDMGRVIFAVNCIDRCDEDDAERVIDSISKRINSYVLEKAKKVMGEDSEEFAVYKRKIGKPKVFGISAKQALKGKIKGNDELIAKSNYPAFEAELERLLTEERGAISLHVQVSKILSSIGEIVKSIQLRENSLRMDRGVFNEKYEAAREEFKIIREKRKEEFNKIDSASKGAYQNLMPKLNEFWPTLLNDAIRIIKDEVITDEDMKKDNIPKTQDRIMKKIKKSSENLGQLLNEQIQQDISVSLGKEATRLQDFEDVFYSTINSIHTSFTAHGSDYEVNSSSTALSTALNYFTFGGGSAYLGYKQAGWKGMLLGGGVGAAATYATSVGAGILLAGIGLPITLPVIIIAGVVSALVGTFTGNKALKWLVPDNKAEKFKTQYIESIKTEYAKLENDSNLDVKVKDQIEASFIALKTKINSETEHILNDMQATLDDLKIKVAQSEVMAEKEQQQLVSMSENITKIGDKANEINKQLIAILNR
ncbi:MAG: hypothetical protein K0S47_375 [Herbinix sp.]|jgi:small GTP-binding protein|nr:hypothetical protein [Herbinix sp.]